MIQLLSPAALLAGLFACGVLFYVYRNRGTAKRLVVSSLIFVGQASKDRSKPKKISIPWRLIFEGIIILLLSSLLARITLLSKSTHELIVIDTSLSSGGLSLDNTTTLSESIKAAQAYILSTPLSQFSVATTNPPKILTKKSSSDEAFRVISTLVPEYGEDNLENNITNWSLELNPSKIHIFTDRPAGNIAENAFIHHQKKKEVPNLAIIDGTLIKENGTVELSNFGGAQKNGAIEIFTSNGKEDLKKESEVYFSVESNSVAAFSFKVSPETQVIKASIKESDLNPLDDEFWFAKKVSGGIEVRSQISIQDLGLLNINEFRFVDKSESPEAIIYHRTNLPEVVTAPSLVILPQEAREIQGAITRWDEESSNLKFAKLGEFVPGKLFSVSSLPPGIDYIFSGNESLLRSTVLSGFKVLFVGFELFPFEGKKSPISTVLFLNFLNFLLDKDSLLPGETNKLFTSAYGLNSPKPGILKSGEAQNFVFKKESQVEDPINLSALLKGKTTEESSESLHQKIILIALILLVIDMILLAWKGSNRKRRRV